MFAIEHAGFLPYRQRAVYLRPIVLVRIKVLLDMVVIKTVTQDASEPNVRVFRMEHAKILTLT